MSAPALAGPPVLDARVRLQRGELALDVELAALRGVTALVGPNGAGKSTLLRALAGLEGSADVRLHGEDVGRRPPHLRRLGLLGAEPLLRPRARVGREVGLVADPGVAREALRLLGLEPLAGRRCRELSSGQAARVGLARALAARPRALLLDEPMARLDAAARPHVRAALRASAEALGVPVLLVTHDPLDVAVLAGRVLVLEAGRVTHDVEPLELVRRPRTPWAARFGGLELLRGRARGPVVLLDDGGELRSAEPHDGEVLVALRATSVVLTSQPPNGSARNAWRCRVRGVEAAGDRLRVELEGSPAVTAEVTPAARDALDLVPGTPVWASVKATDLEIYPA